MISEKLRMRMHRIKETTRHDPAAIYLTMLSLLISVSLIVFSYQANVVPWRGFSSDFSKLAAPKNLRNGIWVEVSPKHIRVAQLPKIAVATHHFAQADKMIRHDLRQVVRRYLHQQALSLKISSEPTRIIFKVSPKTSYKTVRQLIDLCANEGFYQYDFAFDESKEVQL